MQKTNFKKLALMVSLVSLVVLGGAYVGYREYMSMRQARLIKQARKYLTKSDTTRAQLCLRNALRHNPEDLDACRLMAQAAEAARLPSALLWRSRVVQLNPRSLEDRIALAQTASARRDFSTAANALEGVLTEDKKTPAYLNTAGAVAAAANQYEEAEAHFLEAARLEPANMSTQLSLAAVRLHGTNATSLAEARTSLRHMVSSATNAAFRCQAIRELTIDAVHWKQMDAALAFSKELLQQTNAVFKDQLLRLDVLQQAHDAGFKPALEACQREVLHNSASLDELANWELIKTNPSDTLAWLRSLPAQVQTNQPLALLETECNDKVGDWGGLQTFLEHQNWAELEFVRCAFQAHALRGQELASSSKARWEQALKSTNNQESDLAMLLSLAMQWSWRGEAEDILWIIVNKYPGEKWAMRTLAQALLRGGRTRSLMQLFSQESHRMPSDLSAKNNVAMTALLLDAQEVKPLELAREVYLKEPTNSDFASTYALALYLRTNNVEALKVLEQLNPRELEKPSVSGCYGLVLMANGHAAKARKYLDLTSQALLLPEERQLIEKAKTGI
jgi:predicted Zn-dependent protease